MPNRVDLTNSGNGPYVGNTRRLNHLTSSRITVKPIVGASKRHQSMDQDRIPVQPDEPEIEYDHARIAMALISDNTIEYVDSYSEAKQYLSNHSSNVYDMYVGDDVPANVCANIPNNQFEQVNNLRNIYLGANVANISQSAFNLCSELQSVTGLTGVTSIQSSAFLSCTKLKNITLENSKLAVLGTNAFMRCSSLERAVFPNTIQQLTGTCHFQYAYGLQTLILPDTYTGPIPEHFCDMFANSSSEDESQIYGNTLSSLRTLSLGHTASVGNEAFYGCDKLTTLVIPSTCMNIGDNSFYRCWNLTDITFNEGLLSIAHGGFDQCTRLSSIHLPESLGSLGQEAFGDCALLEEVYIGAGIEQIALGSDEPAFNKHASHSALALKPVHFTINKPQGTFTEDLSEWGVPEGSTFTWIG